MGTTEHDHLRRDRLFEHLRAALGLPEDASPFPWQGELLNRFVGGELPNALDIPTGLGKTAVIPIWLVARAAGAPVPRRLVYVVDRRAVVDQATREAERLRSLVETTPELKGALGLDGRKLPISTLRGQFVDNKQWLEDPSAPAIVVGTVDMIGSRLLFSGYGVSRKMRPYHAGLLGADALIVLDEAHLVPPFERLIEQIASGKDANGRALGQAEPELSALVPRFRCLSLSATGRERAASEVFGLTPADRDHPVVRERLSAVKRLMLRAEVPDKELPEALASEAWTLSKEGTAKVRILVFCTSRDHAQAVQAALQKRAPKPDAIDAELFVGGRRVFEREQAARWLQGRGFIAGSAGKPERASFVIATSAGEVGVDLDADHAVCDLVAWERMVQRLGRVNRRGRGEAKVVVVPAALKKGEDEARRAALLKLIGALPSAGDARDVSPEALTSLKADPELRALIEQASTPPLLHPPLTRELVEAWSMTSLEEHTGRPEVAPWIRGWPEAEEEPQTRLVWRTHLPVTSERKLLGKRELEAFRDAADPHLAEQLETETWRVVDWLSKRLKRLRSSEPAPEASEQGERPLAKEDVVAVLFDPRDGQDRTIGAKDLSSKEKREALRRALPGATLMLDCRVGGLRSGLLADDEDTPVPDVTEADQDAEGPPADRIVPFRVRRATQEDRLDPKEGWRIEATLPIRLSSEEEEIEWLVIESLLGQLSESEDGRSSARRAQLLDKHEEWAESEAARISRALNLPAEHLELLSTAARLHDEGKQEACWQRAFHAPGGAPYAKTTRAPNLKILNGYRHELGSLPYAEAHPRVAALSPGLRELCLHLIAAHHGYSRPLIRTTGAPLPPTALEQRAQQVALRFAALEQRWGPWGLAWWEALLRAADQEASRRNDLQGESRG